MIIVVNKIDVDRLVVSRSPKEDLLTTISIESDPGNPLFVWLTITELRVRVAADDMVAAIENATNSNHEGLQFNRVVFNDTPSNE